MAVFKMKNLQRPISVFGMLLTAAGIIGMFSSDSYIWMWFLIAIVGAVAYGGLPNWEAIRRSWRLSGGILLAAVVVIAYYVNLYGWDAMYATLLDSVFYALVIATFVSGTVKKLFKDRRR